jgi:hypothetical protein
MYFTRCKKPRPSEKSTFEHFPDLGSSWKLMHRFQQHFLRIETVLTRKWIFWDFWTHQHVGADLNFRPPQNHRFFGLNPPPPNPLFFEFFDKSPPPKSGCRLSDHFLLARWIVWVVINTSTPFFMENRDFTIFKWPLCNKWDLKKRGFSWKSIKFQIVDLLSGCPEISKNPFSSFLVRIAQGVQLSILIKFGGHLESVKCPKVDFCEPVGLFWPFSPYIWRFGGS